MEFDRAMSVSDFESSYFYAADLKRFARELGITIGQFLTHAVSFHRQHHRWRLLRWRLFRSAVARHVQGTARKRGMRVASPPHRSLA